MRVHENYVMKKHSNMKIGGYAKKFIEIESKSELLDIFKTDERYFIIGNGTNTLLSDKDLNINFISLKKLKNITKLDDEIINVEAGLDFGIFIRYMEKENLSGLEELAGIPGTVGGLVYMNGGAYGKEIFSYISAVEVLNEKNEIEKLEANKLKIGYRSTEIKDRNLIIVSVDFKLTKGFNKKIVEETKRKREENQPIELPNLGSTFKNPKGYFAARLIIEAGLQGFKIGGAQVSMKHPNFIVNDGTATFKDVTQLIKFVQKNVKDKFGIELEREIIILK